MRSVIQKPRLMGLCLVLLLSAGAWGLILQFIL
jgi:hypothetical protein